jgi:membrane protein implicated in regulation of membrane protease activity
MQKSFAHWMVKDAPWYIIVPCFLLYMVGGSVLLTSWLWLASVSGWFGIAVFALPFIVTGFAARCAYKKGNPDAVQEKL